jgi:hypothetical protein
MAKPTRTEYAALLVESGGVHGVRLTRVRGAWSAAAQGFWPLPAAPAPPAETAAPEGAAAPDPDAPWAVVLAEAARSLGVQDPCVALPTSQLLVKVLSLPAGAAADLPGIVHLQMDRLSPFPGDELTVSHELLAQKDGNLQVLAAAVPRAVADQWDRRFLAAGLKPARLDAALLGWWRLLNEARALDPAAGRRAVLIESAGEWDLVIADQGHPVLARGLGVVGVEDLALQVTLSLLSVEVDVGSLPLQEAVVVTADPPREDLMAALRGIGAERVRTVARGGLGQPASGPAMRLAEGAPLDLVPAAWTARVRADVLRRRFLQGLAAAAAVWALAAAGLFFAPVGMRMLVGRKQAEVDAATPAFRDVCNVRDRVRLIRSYMDRSHAALEVLRTVAENQPDGVDLASLAYRREEGAKLAGDAAAATLVLTFKDQIDASRVFDHSTLTGPTQDRTRNRFRFEIDARFATVAGGGGTP